MEIDAGKLKAFITESRNIQEQFLRSMPPGLSAVHNGLHLVSRNLSALERFEQATTAFLKGDQQDLLYRELIKTIETLSSLSRALEMIEVEGQYLFVERFWREQFEEKRSWGQFTFVVNEAMVAEIITDVGNLPIKRELAGVHAG